MEHVIYSSTTSRYPDLSFDKFDDVANLSFIDSIKQTVTLDSVQYKISKPYNHFILECNSYTIDDCGLINSTTQDHKDLMTDQHRIGLMNIFSKLELMEEVFNQEKQLFLRS